MYGFGNLYFHGLKSCSTSYQVNIFAGNLFSLKVSVAFEFFLHDTKREDLRKSLDKGNRGDLARFAVEEKYSYFGRKKFGEKFRNINDDQDYVKCY